MSSSTASTVTKIIVMGMIGLGVLALTLMDVRGVMHTGIGVQDAAIVNGERITTRDLQFAAENMARAMSVPRDQIDAAGLKNYALQAMIAEKITKKTLDDMGLRFDDKAVAEELRTMLTDPNDPKADIAQRYEMMLRQSGQTQRQFEENVRTAIARRIVNEALSAGMLPDTLRGMLDEARANERRDVTLITLTASPDSVKETPSDDDLQAVYDGNQDAFATPESRSGRVYTITEQALKDKAGKDGSEHDLLVEIEDAFFGGSAADDVAKQYGLTKEDDITDLTEAKDEAGKTLFTLDEGEISSAVTLPDNKGYAFVVLDKLTPRGAKPFDEVKDDVAKLWKTQEAAKKARLLEAELKMADKPIDFAKSNGMKVETRSAAAPSDELVNLFNAPTNEVVEMAPNGESRRFGVVTKITRGDASWKPSTATAKDFQSAQSQNTDQLFFQLMGPRYREASIEVNEKALAPAPVAPQE